MAGHVEVSDLLPTRIIHIDIDPAEIVKTSGGRADVGDIKKV
jgi:hypothetical protein